MKNPSFPDETLIIDRFSSKCNACGKSASMAEKAHNVVYTSEVDGVEGCGIEWKYVASSYIGLGIKDLCTELRPDLEWAGYDEESLARING